MTNYGVDAALMTRLLFRSSNCSVATSYVTQRRYVREAPGGKVHKNAFYL
jgi:hypothetical protein